MPKGFSKAQNSNERRGSFQTWPLGSLVFKLQDGERAVVRFIHQADDIEWARKWKLPPDSFHRYGELVNAVDQFEDGTPDPGYQMGLPRSFKAYPLLIWRNAPEYRRDAEGKFLRDEGGGKTVVGHKDQLAFWECTFGVYQTLCAKDGKWHGLASRDAEVSRTGAGMTDTRYSIEPVDIDAGAQPFSEADKRIISSSQIDLSGMVKIPSYDALEKYIKGDAVDPVMSFDDMNNANTQVGGSNPFLGSDD